MPWHTWEERGCHGVCTALGQAGLMPDPLSGCGDAAALRVRAWAV